MSDQKPPTITVRRSKVAVWTEPPEWLADTPDGIYALLRVADGATPQAERMWFCTQFRGEVDQELCEEAWEEREAGDLDVSEHFGCGWVAVVRGVEE